MVIVHRTAVSAGDEVSPCAHVVMSGRSSMRISMEAWRRARDSDATNKVTQATFTFVAITASGTPGRYRQRASGSLASGCAIMAGFRTAR